MDTSINILGLITILLEITLVLEESKKLIVKFVADYDGNPTKNQVVDYMSSQAPAEFRTSRVTTLSIIDELDGDRIRVLKGERRGQSHRLSINDKSRFDWIDQQLTKIIMDIEKMDKDKLEVTLPLKKGGTVSMPSNLFKIINLCTLAYHTSRQIKNDSDQRVLNDKILQAMVSMGIKTVAQFAKKIVEQDESH